jgi:transmembrane sensor
MVNANPPDRDAALEWAQLLSNPIDRATANSFEAWVLEAPQNWKLYLLAVVKHRLHTEPVAAPAAVLSLPVRTKRPAFHSAYPQACAGHTRSFASIARTAFGLIGVAAQALAIASLMGLLRWDAGPQLITAGGTTKVQALEDGSYVTLDPGTRLRVQFSGDRRDVSLERGAAIFEVMYDADRVFRVAIHGGSVESAGTIFRVADNNDRTEVVVYKGSVRVHGTQPGLVFALPVGGTAMVSPEGDVTITPRDVMLNGR